MGQSDQQDLAHKDYSTVDTAQPGGGVGSGTEEKQETAGPEPYVVVTCGTCGNVVPSSQDYDHPCWKAQDDKAYEQKALPEGELVAEGYSAEVLRWVRSLPTTHPNSWDADDWTHFEVLVDNLSGDASDAVWAAVSTRWMTSEESYTYDEDSELAIVQDYLDDADDSDVLSLEAFADQVEAGKRRSKSIHEMTDEEYAEIDSSLQGSEDLLKQWFHDKEEESALCVCNGPGSDNPMYNLHLANCPANPGLGSKDAAGPKQLEHPKYVRTKAGTDPTVQCPDDCAGPGHPNAKYGAHLPKCPCYLPYQGASSGYTSTYVPKDCKHIHDTFKLENGLEVMASAARDVLNKKDIEEEDPRVDIGVYLASSWQPKYLVSTPGLTLPWYEGRPELHVDWPDYKVPKLSDKHALDMFKWVLVETEQGKMFETGCVGGHGRTGTFLACLLTLQGVPPATAIQRVRDEYCKHAIESAEQIEYVAHIHQLEYGKAWRKSKGERRRFNKLLESKAKSYSTGYTSQSRGGGTQTGGSTTSSGSESKSNRYKWNHKTKSWDPAD